LIDSDVAPKFTLLRRTCRQTAALLIAREDAALALPDRLALKLHLFACEACPKFESQLMTVRAAMARWRNYTAEDNSSAPAEEK